MDVTKDVTSLVRGWLRASPCAKTMKFAPSPFALSFSPRPDRLGLGAPEPLSLCGSGASAYQKELERRVQRKVARKRPHQYSMTEYSEDPLPGRSITESSDEEYSRCSSVHKHRPAPAQTGLPVLGADGRKPRKRKKRKKIAPFLPNGGAKQVGKLSMSKDEQVEDVLGSNNTWTQRTRELGSETEQLVSLHSSPSSAGVFPTYKHGDITKTGDNRIKPPQLASLVLQNGHSTTERSIEVKDTFGKLLGGTGQRTDGSKAEKKPTCNVDDTNAHTITTPSTTSTRVKGEEAGGKLSEKCDNTKCKWSLQSTYGSPRKPVSSPRRRKMRRTCLHRGQPFPWSRAREKLQLRHKLNGRKSKRLY